MGGFGDLSTFFDENKNHGDELKEADFYFGGLNKKADNLDKVAKRPVWDGSWLEINPAEYNTVQRLPDNEKRLNSLKQLEELWDHSQKVKRIQKSDDLFFVPDAPTRLENTGQTKESSFNLKATWSKIAQDVRKQMTLGKDIEEISYYLQNKYAAEDLKIATPTIDFLVGQEFGLLGNVYIDPSVFQNPNQTPPNSCEQGAKELKNKAKTAHYLKAIDNCKTCIFNQQGSCAKFNRRIVSNLKYDSKLIKNLTDDLIARGKITTKESTEILKSANPIEGIKKAFTYVKKAERKIGGVQAYPKMKALTKEELDQKIIELKKTAAEKQQLNAALEQYKQVQPIWNYTAKQIIDGHTDKTLKTRIASKFGDQTLLKFAKNLENVLKQQGLLGKLYISTEPWDWNCKKAKAEILHADALNSPFIQRTPKCASCVFNHLDQCSLFNKSITSNLEDVDLKITYPNIIEELYQSKRITASEKAYFLQQKPSLEILKVAYLHTKQRETRIGGVKGKPMPLRMPKVAKLDLPTPVTNFVMKEMHRGVPGQVIKDRLKQKFAAQEYKKENFGDLVQNELGLLGNVYIDPTAYQNCKVGAKELNKTASLAFVKAASKCADCKFNSNGKCSVYKRPILGQVDWKNSDTIDWNKIAATHYQHLLFTNRLTANQIKNLQSIPDQKYALRLAYTIDKEPNPTRIAGVPHEDKAYIRKEKIDRNKIASLINLDFKSGLPIEEITKKYAKALPKFEFDQIVADIIKQNTFPVTFKKANTPAPINYVSDVEQFGLDPTIDIDVIEERKSLDVDNYLGF